jgi:Xaa-Pro aminopeptidase
MRNQLLLPKLATQNRQRFIKKMKPNSMAIFQGTEVLSTNGDAVYTNRPNSDVLWLSGVEQEKSMLVLFPDNPDKNAREVLVLLRPNEHLEKWEGHKLRKDEASAISGIQNIQWADSFDAMLQVMMHNADTVYLNTNENDRLDGSLYRTDLLFVQQIKNRFPLHHYERAARLIKEVRAIKTKDEVAITQQAIDITEKAFRRVLRFVQPGVTENEIEAEIIHEFIKNGAVRHAYDPIIASGDRARVLHYVDNNKVCKSGEIILMDFGASYGNYSADLSRSIPVNGKFTEAQRKIYMIVYKAQQAGIAAVKPGAKFKDFHNACMVEIAKGAEELGVLPISAEESLKPEQGLHRRWQFHGSGHHLGIDVHDCAHARKEQYADAVLEAGMILTVEPGFYIQPDDTLFPPEYRGIGVRIEDDILVTQSGAKILSNALPRHPDEVEAYMARLLK